MSLNFDKTSLYRLLKANDELLKRVCDLEEKVKFLQDKNNQWESIFKDSFTSFKFLKENK